MKFEIVSMPYIGLPPFLRGGYWYELADIKVSMPYIGLPPFLPKISFLKDRQAFIVSMPYIGLPPFPPCTRLWLLFLQLCCDIALCRASPISTDN